MSQSYQTTFWEITDRGRVKLFDNGQWHAIGECTRQEFRDGKLQGGIWSPFCRGNAGELVTFNDLPIGASWIVDYGNMGGEGECLVVLLPGGDRHSWFVDGRATNCTRREDKAHRCWVRHGDPRRCNVTVDKNGDTCQAGAGSIVVPGWHGFLRNGVLVPC